MKWAIKINPHRLSPHARFLFPDDLLVRRAKPMVTDKDVNRTQSLHSLRNRQRTALFGTKICH